MEPARERAAISSPSRNVLLLPPVVAVVFMTTCAATATCAAPSAAAAAPSARAEAWRHTPRTSFVPNPHRRLGSLRHRRPSFDSVQAVRPGKEGASKRGRIAVDADSWYLGDGGFADRHLDDEEHIAAKKVRYMSPSRQIILHVPYHALWYHGVLPVLRAMRVVRLSVLC